MVFLRKKGPWWDYSDLYCTLHFSSVDMTIISVVLVRGVESGQPTWDDVQPKGDLWKGDPWNKMEYAAGGNNATCRSTTRYWFCCRGGSHNCVQYILCSSIMCAMLLRWEKTVFVDCSNFVVVISQTDVAVSPLGIQRKRSINAMQYIYLILYLTFR
jgi:hypothetical protein